MVDVVPIPDPTPDELAFQAYVALPPEEKATLRELANADAQRSQDMYWDAAMKARLADLADGKAS